MKQGQGHLIKGTRTLKFNEKVVVNCEFKTERDTTSLDCAVVNKQPKDRNLRTKLKPNQILGYVELECFGGWRRTGRGGGGGGGAFILSY